jgi:hypothetical protein
MLLGMSIVRGDIGVARGHYAYRRRALRRAQPHRGPPGAFAQASSPCPAATDETVLSGLANTSHKTAGRREMRKLAGRRTARLRRGYRPCQARTSQRVLKACSDHSLGVEHSRTRATCCRRAAQHEVATCPAYAPTGGAKTLAANVGHRRGQAITIRDSAVSDEIGYTSIWRWRGAIFVRRMLSRDPHRHGVLHENVPC